ncbi:MAG: D-cysteine desulfhydrase family protein [Chloroflexi bacterium]|nr:MAG: D-cysteine desulfhydrase family protein [Chloroflexota bacterium]
MNSNPTIPRIRFAALPTPVEPLPRLSAQLRGPRLLVKRDDLTGLAFGGNKTRKLEFILAEAQAYGARTLITVGAAQSNHCRQTAALAARAGLDCILVLSGRPEEKPTGNLLLDGLFGVEIVWTSRAEREVALQMAFDVAWEEGRRPYLIPLGASNALGTLAYEAAFQEFLAQSIPVDTIVVASSSGGTQAGLALGARRAGWKGRVLGISIDEPVNVLQRVVADLASAAAERLGEKITIQPEAIQVNADYLGEGYGVMGEAEREAIRLFARHEGLLLDPVYTGRAAAGMIDLIRQGTFQQGESLLFWHTGGSPALFASRYAESL